MRVLHGPVEVSGQVVALAAAQRQLGVRADAWCPPHPFAYPRLSGPRPRAPGRLLHRAELLAFLASVPLRYDVVHLHGGQSFLQPRFRQRDAAALVRCGTPVLQQFVGSDARLPSVEQARNPFYLNSFGEDDNLAHARMARWAELSQGHCAVQDHALDVALRQHFDQVHVVPLCVPVTTLAAAPPEPGCATPVLMHAPSNHAGKGTDLVRAAVTSLQQEGLRFTYEELSGRSHAEVIDQLARADLVVDQLRLGSFGAASVEAWALGKPVVCYVLPELWATYPPGLPLIAADPTSLVQVLREWLTDGPMRHARGRESRLYAEAHHDARHVAEAAHRAYEAVA